MSKNIVTEEMMAELHYEFYMWCMEIMATVREPVDMKMDPEIIGLMIKLKTEYGKQASVIRQFLKDSDITASVEVLDQMREATKELDEIYEEMKKSSKNVVNLR